MRNMTETWMGSIAPKNLNNMLALHTACSSPEPACLNFISCPAQSDFLPASAAAHMLHVPAWATFQAQSKPSETKSYSLRFLPLA